MINENRKKKKMKIVEGVPPEKGIEGCHKKEKEQSQKIVEPYR